MSVQSDNAPTGLTWSNPLSWWWAFLALVSGLNIALWLALYQHLQRQAASAESSSAIGLMLLLCAGYVFGCAFRSVLPRADVQRICLFDTWLSSVVVGRSVATVAEVCFAAQWAILLHYLGTLTGTTAAQIAALAVVPLIVIAEGFSWYAVLTRHYLGNAIENSIWAVAFFIIGIGLCLLIPQFDGAARIVIAFAIAGIAGYLVFLVTVDVPMYLARWRSDLASGMSLLGLRQGARDVTVRWVVTHDIAEWREEMAWMSLYFSGAVWSSLALSLFYSWQGHLVSYLVVAQSLP